MTNGQWAGYERRERRPERRVIFVSGDRVTSYRVRPWIAAPLALLCGVFAVTYLAATAYLIYRDDLIALMTRSNVESVRAYEDRIAALRGEIDRISSRQILDQVAFEGKIDSLMDRQAALNDRQRLVASIIDQARRSGLDVLPTASAPARQPAPANTEDADAGPSAPIGIPVPAAAYSAVPAHATTPFDALLDTRRVAPAPTPAPPEALRIDGSAPDLALIALDLGRMSLEQTAAIAAVASSAEAEIGEIAGIIEPLGLELPDTATAGEETDIGGPYLPAQGGNALQVALDDAQDALGRLQSARAAVAELPLGSPLPGAVMTSRFGNRRDPFLRRAAFHGGIDFRAPTGESIHPTAPGRVVSAGWSGGYGNMVEVDHGDGLSTRYGHLSRITVRVGDRVDADTVIGRAGSTGRSTGPHLHYEMRVNGRAVNPAPYISAGEALQALRGG